MRILMLSDYFPPHMGGGVERVAAELCSGLVRRGHTVGVLTLRTCPAPREEVRDGLAIHRVPAIDLTPWLGVQFSVSARVLTSAFRLVRRFRPDVIHAHNLFFRTTEVAAALRCVFDVPLITTLHLGKAEGGGRLLRTLIRSYESTMGRFIVRRSDHVIAVSNAVGEHAGRMGGSATRVTVIPNGVDMARFCPGSNGGNSGQKVLFVARLVPNKGPDTLLRAVPGVLDRHPQAQFAFVGDGPLRSSLEQLAERLDVARSVHFMGLRDDVPELMRESTVFVRPSSLEGMPLTVLEAMASGVPVVATPVAGTAELLADGTNGFAIPVDADAELATAVCKLLDDRPLAERMGRRGRQIVESGYSWDAVVDRTEQVYERELCRR